MSVRYGVELALDPKFTARAYRTRQLVCGQYGCWAAEMHMLRLTLAHYFHCPDEVLPDLAGELGRVAASSRARSPGLSIDWSGISQCEETGSVAIDFSTDCSMGSSVDSSGADGPLLVLQSEAIAAIAGLPDVHVPGTGGPFRPKVALLEYGGLPSQILADAAEYAREVAADLAVPPVAHAWRLLLLRYVSEAAGDDWSNGRWAADVSWKQLHSFPL